MVRFDATLEGALRELSDVAWRCPGFGMCRTDFLHTGICPPGRKYRYASFFPQGRLQIIAALNNGEIPVTKSLHVLAESCSECGICDKQCYFVAEFQPMQAFMSFKQLMRDYRGPYFQVTADDNVRALADIVGTRWVSNDPAIRAAYTKCRSPLPSPTYPAYIVLPASTQEVAALIIALNRLGLEYVVRGSGTSFSGALTSGVVVDLCRMDHITILDHCWCAVVEPGVTAFSLQKAAMERRMRAPVAEPAACVCANIISTNMHSLFSYAYGLGIDHCIDAEFVGPDGSVFSLAARRSAESIVSAEESPAKNKSICTRMSIKLHPVPPGEGAILVPFGSYAEAIEFTHSLAIRGICTAIGVLGTEYASMFLAPTSASECTIRRILEDDMGIHVILLAIGDSAALATLKQISQPILDKDVLADLLRNLPVLDRNPGYQVLTEFESGEGYFRKIFSEDSLPLLTMALRSDAATAADIVIPELREFFVKLAAREHLADAVWLNSFRIVSARMGRGHQFVSRILWLDFSENTPIAEICARLAVPAEHNGLSHSFGYLVPLYHGKQAVMEYDYYYDAHIAAQREAAIAAIEHSRKVIAALRDEGLILCSGEDIVDKGFSRPEGYLSSGGILA